MVILLECVGPFGRFVDVTAISEKDAKLSACERVRAISRRSYMTLVIKYGQTDRKDAGGAGCGSRKKGQRKIADIS